MLGHVVAQVVDAAVVLDGVAVVVDAVVPAARLKGLCDTLDFAVGPLEHIGGGRRRGPGLAWRQGILSLPRRARRRNVGRAYELVEFIFHWSLLVLQSFVLLMGPNVTAVASIAPQ
jgi:hypothetical protein